MPYEISFLKLVKVQDEDAYINECCYGGDVVSDQLLPSIRSTYSKVEADQEDWGWFIWFRDGAVSLSVDIFCDEPEAGAFRIHITSRKTRWFIPSCIVDTPELEKLKDLIAARLNNWVGSPVTIVPLNKKYL